MDLAADLALAVELADAAGALALRRFRAPDLRVETKPDGSAVTDADKAAERLLRERLAAERPGDLILGEEEGGPIEPGGRRWLLDPIDGTSHFVAGRPDWMVFVTLEVDGKVVAGAVAQPASGHRWRAAGGMGAFRDGDRLRVSRVDRLAAASLHDDWRGTLTTLAAASGRGALRPAEARASAIGPPDPAVGALLVPLASATAGVVGSDEEGFLAVAAGRADLCAGVGGEPWDHAALKIVVEEAGGRFTDLDGEDTIGSGHALVSNGLLHDEALAVLRRLRRR